MINVTVVIPTFNRALTIERALKSVLEQTLKPSEIIVVDDASSDDTREVISSYSGVNYIQLDRNYGAGHARNVGVQKAKNDYIAFIDSDDVWLPRKLEVQREYIMSHSDIDLLCSGLVLHRENGETEDFEITKSLPIGGFTFDDFIQYPFSPSTWMIRKDSLISAGLFDPNLKNCEDLDLLARLNDMVKISVIPDKLVLKFNQHDGLDSNLSKRSISINTIYNRHRDLWGRSSKAGYYTFLKMASMHFKNNQPNEARNALLTAAKFRPTAFGIWARLVLSYAPLNLYNFIRKKVSKTPV